MALEFTEDQGKIFDLLLKKQEALDARDIAAQTGVDQPLVAATLNSCQEQGWVTIEEKEREELVLADDALAQVDKGLPERQVISLLAKEGKIKIRDLVGILQ
jgi:Mn-dependent DtxR family transcriptional regulator